MRRLLVVKSQSTPWRWLKALGDPLIPLDDVRPALRDVSTYGGVHLVEVLRVLVQWLVDVRDVNEEGLNLLLGVDRLRPA
ncbi:hypothetical protein [Nocardioides sp. W7]|uniref:hypothetical protein n=1 Tax=Nocardioides sp. W7 TaxID=2931390 RepID=UPI001FCF9AD5|nr:hypothetical protein [Nocardioides sp. W7]